MNDLNDLQVIFFYYYYYDNWDLRIVSNSAENQCLEWHSNMAAPDYIFQMPQRLASLEI